MPVLVLIPVHTNQHRQRVKNSCPGKSYFLKKKKLLKSKFFSLQNPPLGECCLDHASFCAGFLEMPPWLLPVWREIWTEREITSKKPLMIFYIPIGGGQSRTFEFNQYVWNIIKWAKILQAMFIYFVFQVLNINNNSIQIRFFNTYFSISMFFLVNMLIFP